MRRNMFFWIEKLRITPGERIAVVTLMILLLILTILNQVVKPVLAYGPDDYREIKAEFDRRTALLAQKKTELLKQYYPPETDLIEAVADTLPAEADSAIVINEAEKKETQVSGSGRVNINTASIEELKTLPGIGPAYAQRIIDYREQNGPFRSVDDLVNIKGIGEKRLEKLRPLIEI